MVANKRNKHNFTIVEIALALVVITVGISALLVLFPIGMQAAQNAIGDSAASNAAETFIPYIQSRVDIADLVEVGGKKVNQFLNDFSKRPADNASDNLNWSAAELDMIYSSNVRILQKGQFYRIMQKSLGKDAKGDEQYALDFDGIARIWTEPIRGLWLENYQIDKVPDEYGAGIYLEISWPAEKPYSAREKRLYYFEHFNRGVK